MYIKEDLMQEEFSCSDPDAEQDGQQYGLEAGKDMTNDAMQYISMIADIPLLDHEEEIELAKRIEAGDEDAAEKLTCSNLRLVISVAKKYMHMGLPFMDLIQEGNIGLMRAVKKYDHRIGVRFSTYAYWWIRQGITAALDRETGAISIPPPVQARIRKIRSVMDEYRERFGRSPTLEEIMMETGFNENRTREAILCMDRVLSLDMVLPSDDDTKTLLDTIEDYIFGSVEETVEKMFLKESMESAVEQLDDKEKDIISSRYGLNGKKERTLEDISNDYGVTRQRIGQIEAQTLDKMKRRSRVRKMSEFLID